MRMSRHKRMSDGSAAFAAVFLTTWVLGGEPPTTGPRFTGNELPEPPQQHSQWSAPPAQLSTNLVSSVEVLFQLGLADPRGCEYREYETVVGSVWGGSGNVKAHGWILPASSRQQLSFAVSWVGTVYPVIRVGKKADLKQDMEELLRADAVWPEKSVSQS